MTTLTPLRFHSVKGTDVILLDDNRRVERVSLNYPFGTAFGYGGAYNTGSAVVFSHRPVQVGEVVRLRIQLPHFTDRVKLAMGFTTTDPNTLSKVPCTRELRYLPGYWVRVRYTDSDGVLQFYVDSLGNVQYNGSTDDTQSLGEVTGSLWMVAVVPLEPFFMKFDHQASGGESSNEGESVLDSPPSKASSLHGSMTQEPVPVSCIDNNVIPVLTSLSTKQNAHGDTQQGELTATADLQTSARSECIICFVNVRDTAMSPCGHLYTCYSCALDLWQGRGRGTCPTCRQQITNVLRVFQD